MTKRCPRTAMERVRLNRIFKGVSGAGYSASVVQALRAGCKKVTIHLEDERPIEAQ
jgi:hypothetical protein